MESVIDNKKIADDLKKIEPGFLNESLFNQVARLGVLSYLEYLVFRTNKNKVEVILTKRSSEDKFWPNLYHNPGTVLRPNDKDMSFVSALERLNTEYGYKLPEPFFAGMWFEQLERGKGLGIICWQEIEDVENLQYFDITKLPTNMIKGQARYIKKAAEDYIKFKRGNFNPMPLNSLLLQ